MSLQNRMRYMNAYDVHKMLINEYVFKRPGDTRQSFRDSSKDKRDFDVIREHHKFLWEDDDAADTWEAQFAKKYYDKLFKEYCIGDLSRYKENKIAMRWRTEQEVVAGKGQFICANKKCALEENLRTWEVNFAYIEDEIKKNALIKIRLCPDCSKKLNYHSKKKEIKRLHDGKKRRKSRRESESESAAAGSSSVDVEMAEEGPEKIVSDSPWENVKPVESKSRDEEMEEYLQDLLL